MGDFFVLQMDDTFTESVCFDTSKEGKGELRPYERSRFAEHIGKVEELCYGVLCPPHRR
jgi:hypothetical protein